MSHSNNSMIMWFRGMKITITKTAHPALIKKIWAGIERAS